MLYAFDAFGSLVLQKSKNLFGHDITFKHCSGSAFLLLETRLKLRGEVGGKACEAPPVAEEANRVWRSGRLFARIRAEKDGNRKWKRDC